MRAAAEAQQLRADVAADAELVGVVEHPLVAVGRTGHQQQGVSVVQGGAVKIDVLDDGAGQDLAGGVVAQRLLHPQRNPVVVSMHTGQLIGVSRAPKSRIAKQFRRGLITRDHHQKQKRHDFIVAEPVAVDLSLQ